MSLKARALDSIYFNDTGLSSYGLFKALESVWESLDNKDEWKLTFNPDGSGGASAKLSRVYDKDVD